MGSECYLAGCRSSRLMPQKSTAKFPLLAEDTGGLGVLPKEGISMSNRPKSRVRRQKRLDFERLEPRAVLAVKFVPTGSGSTSSHELLISSEMGAEKPLIGLSFECRRCRQRRRCSGWSFVHRRPRWFPQVFQRRQACSCEATLCSTPESQNAPKTQRLQLNRIHSGGPI